ncbi:MAG: DUF2085 domain-containing protein [Lachnospiraceae bacterium]
MPIKQKLLWLLRTAGNYSGCHQLPERSFFYKGKQFPVCARCTGVSIGQLLSILVNMRFRRGSLLLSVLALSCMGADWLIQETGIKESTNRRRLITGMLGGFGLFNLYFLFYYNLKHFLLQRRERFPEQNFLH